MAAAYLLDDVIARQHLQESESWLREHLRARQAVFEEYGEMLSSVSQQLGQLSASVADIPTSPPRPSRRPSKMIGIAYENIGDVSEIT
jgi:hypothetical protein